MGIFAVAKAAATAGKGDNPINKLPFSEGSAVPFIDNIGIFIHDGFSLNL